MFLQWCAIWILDEVCKSKKAKIGSLASDVNFQTKNMSKTTNILRKIRFFKIVNNFPWNRVKSLMLMNIVDTHYIAGEYTLVCTKTS